ncbi:MAG: helix-turn-helix transcriptional regulator [Angelakisella sp.]|jgi:transcriptional regulator with XRE-family HTH domain|nr:helix-turn-helix transcriptional regulator [Angelakisella sp.]
MLGERLAYLRRRENISQKDLGKQLSISHYTISSYEKGRSEPNDEIKIRIARYFNVSLDYLMGLIDQPYPFDREDGVIYLPQLMSPALQRMVKDFLVFWEQGQQIQAVEATDTPAEPQEAEAAPEE